MSLIQALKDMIEDLEEGDFVYVVDDSGETYFGKFTKNPQVISLSDQVYLGMTTGIKFESRNVFGKDYCLPINYQDQRDMVVGVINIKELHVNDNIEKGMRKHGNEHNYGLVKAIMGT